MDNPLQKFQDDIQNLTREVVAKLPVKIQQIEEIWQQLCQNWDPDLLTHLVRLTHNLAGLAGTFGFQDVWTKAQSLERVMEDVQASYKENPPEERKNQIQNLLDQLKRVALK